MAKLTIGVPVFNGEASLPDALDALLGQSFSDFEMVVSDNASDDGTREICERYAARDTRIRYVRQGQNLGAPANFQFVLDQAETPYFMWAAADDLWDATYAATCVGELERRPDVDLCATRYWVLSQRLPALKMKRFPPMRFASDADPFVRVQGYMLMPEPSHKANLLYGVWRRHAAREFMRIYQEHIGPGQYRYAGDSVQLACVLARSKAFQVDEPLFFKCYRLLPPGHLLGVLLKLPRTFGSWPRRKREYYERHTDMVERVLRAEGLWDERYRRVLDAKRQHEDYGNPSNLWRTVLTSWGVGFC